MKVETADIQEMMRHLRLCVVVPTYNNRGTLEAVVEAILAYSPMLIVVDDGSTDETKAVLAEIAGRDEYKGRIEVIESAPNRGKGYSLGLGFDKAEELGYKGAITMDSDGQHYASDITKFVDVAADYQGYMLIGQRSTEGDMPMKNTFANKFSNFWFTVHTGRRLSDTQNGFRLYPLAEMRGLRPLSSRYEAELEMLVRSAWRGIRIMPVPVRVYYPPENERVTHFRPGKDFFRISVLNTLFTLLAVVYGYPSMLYHYLRRL